MSKLHKTTKSEGNVEKILDELSVKYERVRVVLFKEYYTSIWILFEEQELILFEEDKKHISKNPNSKGVTEFIKKLGGKPYKKVFLEKKICNFSEDYIAKRLYGLYGKWNLSANNPYNSTVNKNIVMEKVNFKQIFQEEDLVGKTIERIYNDSERIFIFFTDKSFGIFRSMPYVDNCAELDENKYDLTPRPYNFRDLFAAGFITEEDFYKFKKEVEIAEADRQKEKELETLRKLQEKYGNLWKHKSG